MSYKTILVHVDGSPHAATRIALAAQLALQYDAHLVGAALTGVSRLFYQEASADLARTALAPYMDALYRRTERDLGHFTELAVQTGVRSHEQRLVDDEAGAGLVLCARYADLAVLGQADPDLAPPLGGDPVPYVLLTCPRPLLVVPYIQRNPVAGKRVLVAWNGSAEAVRAVSAALPLLRLADRVAVAMFGPPQETTGDPELVRYLKRHGIDTAPACESVHLDPGERLLSLLADQGADLLVMGGYGRARLSELLLGGVTRTVLQAMTVPVLLAH